MVLLGNVSRSDQMLLQLFFFFLLQLFFFFVRIFPILPKHWPGLFCERESVSGAIQCEIFGAISGCLDSANVTRLQIPVQNQAKTGSRSFDLLIQLAMQSYIAISEQPGKKCKKVNEKAQKANFPCIDFLNHTLPKTWLTYRTHSLGLCPKEIFFGGFF